MKAILKYHLFAILVAVILAYFSAILVLKLPYFSQNKYKTKQFVGTKISFRGLHENLVAKESLEFELLGSLKEKKGITLFGSSELATSSKYIPFSYLPDTFGFRVNAFGHAFQQSFSIYCQLLALKENLKNANVCIIVSPGWFETEGTNMEAFLEFVRPNFLKKIIHDKHIPLIDKLYIGKYIYSNYSIINHPNTTLNYFKNLFQYQNIPILNNYFAQRTNNIDKINYQLIKNQKLKNINYKVNWNKEIAFASKEFIKTNTTNKLFIENNYFDNEILKNGKIRKGHFDKINVSNNQEWKDLQQLIKLLKKEKCKATFIIQGLNPYHYLDLENFNPMLKEICKTLKSNNFPFLNQFTSAKQNYLPGRLNDIMHTGDVGWLEVNQFLVNYYGN